MTMTPEQRAERIAEMNAELRAAGIPVRMVREDAAPVTGLPIDTRSSERWCQICCATVHPQRKKHLRSGQVVCGMCRSMAYDERPLFQIEYSAEVLERWLGMPPTQRRGCMVKEFGVDPATEHPQDEIVEFTEVVTTPGGDLLGVEHAAFTRSAVRPRPRMSWDILHERGKV